MTSCWSRSKHFWRPMNTVQIHKIAVIQRWKEKLWLNHKWRTCVICGDGRRFFVHSSLASSLPQLRAETQTSYWTRSSCRFSTESGFWSACPNCSNAWPRNSSRIPATFYFISFSPTSLFSAFTEPFVAICRYLLQTLRLRLPVNADTCFSWMVPGFCVSSPVSSSPRPPLPAVSRRKIEPHRGSQERAGISENK